MAVIEQVWVTMTKYLMYIYGGRGYWYICSIMMFPCSILWLEEVWTDANDDANHNAKDDTNDDVRWTKQVYR